MDHLHLDFESEKGLKSSSFDLPFTSSHSHPRRRSSSSSAILLILVSIPFFFFYFVSPFSHLSLSILDRVIPHPPSSSTPDPFNWTRCSVQPNQTSNPGSSFKCSNNFKVPLDYSDPLDQRTISLALTLFQSGREKSNHTIILNPGGPGGSGTDYAYRKAEEIDLLLGGGIDVLGFDPRGVNLSEPSLSCFPSDSYRDRYTLLTNQALATVSDPIQNLALVDAYHSAIFQACQAIHGDLPSYLSTAFVVRDIDLLRETLGEDQLWSYFVSYGTGIGQHYSQMFPERVGRMMLDGVENAMKDRRAEWFSKSMLYNITDAWEDGFLRECVEAGPSKCALAKPSNLSFTSEKVTLTALKERMSSLLDSLKTKPLAGYLPSSGPSILTYSTLIELIFFALYDATKWPLYSQLLSELENGNTTLALLEMEKRWEYDPNADHSKSKRLNSGELMDAVVCDDGYLSHREEPRSLEFWAEIQRNMTIEAPIGGDSVFYDAFVCRNYPWKAKEVYKGYFNHTLSNPLLLISETHDPATPLQNGKEVLEMLGKGNGRLVIHHGYGHSSRDKSKCTHQIIKNLFTKGEFPSEEITDCYADTKPFDKDLEELNL